MMMPIGCAKSTEKPRYLGIFASYLGAENPTRITTRPARSKPNLRRRGTTNFGLLVKSRFFANYLLKLPPMRQSTSGSPVDVLGPRCKVSLRTYPANGVWPPLKGNLSGRKQYMPSSPQLVLRPNHPLDMLEFSTCRSRLCQNLSFEAPRPEQPSEPRPKGALIP